MKKTVSSFFLLFLALEAERKRDKGDSPQSHRGHRDIISFVCREVPADERGASVAENARGGGFVCVQDFFTEADEHDLCQSFVRGQELLGFL